MSSYSEKSIRVTITLDSGSGIGEQMVFEDFAIQVMVQKQGAPELPKASVVIYGLTLETMSQLTMLSFDALSLKKNVIEIAAGEKGHPLAVIFQGEIVQSSPDFSSAPSPGMRIDAITSAYPKLIPLSPVAVKGSQAAADLCASFAAQAGLAFESIDVSAQLANCVVSGDPIQKMRWIADSIGADLIIDDDRAVLMGRGSTRGEEQTIDLISPENGEIGYPSFDNLGIRCSCFFQPGLKVAGYFRLESSFKRASGVWKIYSLTHSLAANCPSGGPWKTDVAATWIE